MSRLQMRLGPVTGRLCAAIGVVSWALLPVAGAEGFEAVVKPYLEAHCADCHDAETAKGDVVLTDLGDDFSAEENALRWQRVLEQVQADVMPPMKAKERPAADERRAVIDWIGAELLASPHGGTYRKKLMMPEYGNLVDHARLFSGEIQAPAFSPSRLWRLSPHIFAAKGGVNRAVKGRQNPFTYSTSPHGIRDFAATSRVGASTVETIVLNANSELEFLLEEGKEAAGLPEDKRRRPHAFAPFFRDSQEITPEELERPVVETFRRLVSREPTAEEVAKYLALLQQNLSDSNDPAASLKTTLKAIYLSPEAIYRMEWGLGEEDEHGRRMLAPEEIAYALAYALYDEGPYGGRSNSKLIGEALRAGQLETREDVVKLVKRLTGLEMSPPIGGQAKDTMPRAIRFFHEFFGYPAAVDVFKDNERTAAHDIYNNPRTLVKDADNLLKVILREDRKVFEELLTTPRALVFHEGDNQRIVDNHRREIADLETWDEARVEKEIEKRKAGVLKKPKYKNNPKLVGPEHARIERLGKTMLAEKRQRLDFLRKSGPVMRSVKSRDLQYIKAYNLTPGKWRWPAEQPFELPSDQRAGLLTHPAWLVAHSLNDGNDPISRGIWVYEKLLAGVIADVPPDVDARVPKDPHKTLRERMGMLRDNDCWICHRKINPLGEPFEMFDDFGRFRDRHYFDKEGKLVTERFANVKNDSGEAVRRRIDLAGGDFTNRPVDSSGSFDGLGVPGLEGDYANAVEMIHAIAKTDRARQSMIRHLFRYLMGRNEMLSDSRTLIAADRAYLESGGSFKALLVSLLSSDSFLYRR